MLVAEKHRPSSRGLRIPMNGARGHQHLGHFNREETVHYGGGGMSRFIVPLALAVVGTLVAPGIGTALGSAISGTGGTALGTALGGMAEGISAGALGAGVGSAVGTKMTGGTWGQSLLSGAGSYLGGQLLGGGGEGSMFDGTENAFDVGSSLTAEQAAAQSGQIATGSLLDSSIGSVIPSALGDALPGSIMDAAGGTTFGSVLGSYAGSQLGNMAGTMIDPPKLQGGEVILNGSAAQSNIGNAILPTGNVTANSTAEEATTKPQNMISQIGYGSNAPSGVSYLMPIANKDTGKTGFGSYTPTSYGNQEARNRRSTWGSLVTF